MIPLYKSQLNPQTLSTEFINSITGEYGEGRKINFENGILHFINKNGKYKMTYINDNTFAIEDKEYRLKFPDSKSTPRYYDAFWKDGGSEKSNRISK
jgi:hypothetical protein